jgi:hypothetical protein
MIKVIMYLDNQSTSTKGPVDFVKKYYLTKEAKEDLYIIEASEVNKQTKEVTKGFDLKG